MPSDFPSIEDMTKCLVIPLMGWLQLEGSLKLQGGFAEYSLFYRALLQKRHIFLEGLLIVATSSISCHGVATISRLFEMIGLFCKRALLLRRYSARETYDFKEPTNRSHPMIPWNTKN